ncbi:uncharacterized protein LOC124408001 [Diprion similis]|uniref:uncharacterized protein LOC124408001 n=1 Tax=Diprion similis TaxID=362088 RepID=UPI001EF81441|nr:uncharacterized protein LOC124408001 [Diprion similis]XP_046740598.1 uncharacterized protein LOC124408001 [Diprion similis]
MWLTSCGSCSLGILLCAAVIECIPKFESGGGFVPSSGGFMSKVDKMDDQVAMSSETRSVDASAETSKRSIAEENDVSDRNQEPRFGFTSVGTTGTGYGGISNYAPAKLDLGGILLGAIIGVGTILVIPKLLYVFSGSYGAYARSDEGGITQTMARLDDALARYGVDTTSCMQRAVCTYTKQATTALRDHAGHQSIEEVSPLDRAIDAVVTNQVFQTAMEGTAVQDAIQTGKEGQDCPRVYSHCGLSLEALFALFTTMMTSASPSTVRTPMSTPLL